MKIVDKLTATAAEGQWDYRQGATTAVMSEVILAEKKTGVFRQVELGPAGLLVHQGDIVVGIPLTTIVDLAVSIDPRFEHVRPAQAPDGK